MDFIKYCDFFEARFHFYSNNHSSNSRLFGGMMFILYTIISLLVFLLYSYDNLNKLNPITTTSESPDIAYDKIKTTEEKIWIPWRISTYEGNSINHKGLLYPVIYLVHGEENKNKIIDLQYERLNYKLCNETSMINNTDHYKIDINLDNLFCIDNEDIYLGGSRHLGYIYFLEINIYLCENGKKFNIDDEKCTSFQELSNFQNKSLYFEYFFPEVRFKPHNYESPIEVIYREHFYEIKDYHTKYERLFLRKNILSDDKSLFIKNPKNISFWGIDSLYGDAYLSEIYDSNNKNPSSKIFSLSIFMGKGFIYFTRYYKKFYDILSDIFPILNIIIFIFREFTVFIKFCWIRKRIFELLFENCLEDNCNKNDKSKNNVNFNFNINSASNHNFRYEPFNKFRKEFERRPLYERRNYYGNRISHQALGSFILRNRNNTKEIIRNKSNVSLSNLSNSNYGLNLEFKVINKNIKKTEIINKPPRNIIAKKRMSKTVIQNYNNNYRKKLYLKKQKKTLFPFIFYISDFFTNRSSGKNKFFFVSKDYLIVYKFINKVYDITSFLILYKQFNIMKNIYAKGKLLDIINTNSKMNIKNKDLNEELSMNSLNNVFQTFSEILIKEQNF